MIILGIDPGASGAVAFMDADDGSLLGIEDMPVDTVKVGKHSRSRLSRVRALALFEALGDAHAFSERPEARPLPAKDPKTGRTVMRQPGAAGMFGFGESFGGITMAAVAKGVALTEMRPGMWKKEIGASSNKDECRRLAAEWFPAFANMFSRKKDDGRAEAALMCVYGRRVLSGQTIALKEVA